MLKKGGTIHNSNGRTYLQDKSEILVEDIIIEVQRKKIKNLHLRVTPPDGHVRVSAPMRIREDMIRTFVVSKIDWIRKHRDRIKAEDPQAPYQFVCGESHFFMGKSYRLEVIEREAKPCVETEAESLKLYVRPGTGGEKRRAVIEEFYRSQLKLALLGIIGKWENEMKVKVKEFRIKKMKTKWGTCNRKDQRIWINLELCKKPPECLEYIVVHEMVHLLERYHNNVFYGHMDSFLPQWRTYKSILNS